MVQWRRQESCIDEIVLRLHLDGNFGKKHFDDIVPNLAATWIATAEARCHEQTDRKVSIHLEFPAQTGVASTSLGTPPMLQQLVLGVPQDYMWDGNIME